MDIAGAEGELVINAVIYAEFSIAFQRAELLDTFLDGSGIRLVEIPRPALFLAGDAYRSYRRRGGTKAGVLPDFFIGAHAAASGLTILTRDVARFRTYFPAVKLITPFN